MSDGHESAGDVEIETSHLQGQWHALVFRSEKKVSDTLGGTCGRHSATLLRNRPSRSSTSVPADNSSSMLASRTDARPTRPGARLGYRCIAGGFSWLWIITPSSLSATSPLVPSTSGESRVGKEW